MNTNTARQQANIEVTELHGQEATELLVSDFGALSLVPIERDTFEDKLRRVFALPAREEKRGKA